MRRRLRRRLQRASRAPSSSVHVKKWSGELFCALRKLRVEDKIATPEGHGAWAVPGPAWSRMAPPKEGDRVKITSGKYENMVGAVSKVTAKTCQVLIDGESKPTGNLKHDAVEVLKAPTQTPVKAPSKPKKSASS